MKKLNINNKDESGFSILGILLVIVFLAVALATYLLSGKTNTSSTNSATAKVMASSVLNDASSIQTAFDMKVLMNGVSKQNITFTTDGSPNSILSTDHNGIEQPAAPAGAIRKDAAAPDGIYAYVNTAYTIPGSIKKAIVLTGIRTDVCKQINFTLYGKEDIPTYLGAEKSNTVSTGATRTNPNTTHILDLDLAGIKDGHYARGWNAGCMTSADSNDQNFFYKILG